MTGVFFSKLRGILLSLLFIVGGTAAAILLGVVLFSDLSSVSLAEFLFLFLMMCFMLLLACLGILLLLYNHGAYFVADEMGISAKFGLHDPKSWTWAEILRIDFAPNQLIVKLKNGKTYSVGFLVNAKELYDYCRPHIAERKLPSAEVIRGQLHTAKQKRRLYIVYIVLAFAVVFGAIFFSGYYVGEDLHALTVSQTGVFVCCTVAEIVAVVIAFVLAEYSGKYTRMQSDLQSDLMKALVPEKTKKAFADAHVVRLMYFEDYRYRVSVHTAEDERGGGTYYCFMLERFNLGTEDWTDTALPACEIFASELEALDAVYTLYDDTVFEEYVK
ncbi:MAG: hypothetical protein IJX64_06600 [Clostridia bacterium]|nr:hypothetical protein [Clostridia bacterium]